MFGFGRKHRDIIVDFFEGDTAIPFASSKVPLEQLPDTFEIRTTLALQGEEWLVTDASPRKKGVRKEIPAPLDGVSLALADLMHALAARHSYRGVAFSDAAATVVRGFAFKNDAGLDVWGQQSATGVVTAVCFQGNPFEGGGLDARASLDRFLSQHHLVFVDWNRPDAVT
jgi:hypothetical protein